MEPELRIPRTEARRKLEERIELAQQMLHRPVTTESQVHELKSEFRTWHDYNRTLLRRLFTTTGPAEAYEPVAYLASGSSSSPQRELELVRIDIEHQHRKLVSLRDQLELYDELLGSPEPARVSPGGPGGKTVFFVHGHDGERKLEVAHLIERITEQRPTILHELPNRGRTIIEKLEDHSAEAGFAVVLLTGDDVGGLDRGTLRPRARQNVVLELGLFIGLLGREHVVALHEHGVELPSDVEGVLYVSLEENWQLKLAQEMQAAGIALDLNKALKP